MSADVTDPDFKPAVSRRAGVRDFNCVGSLGFAPFASLENTFQPFLEWFYPVLWW